jgi:outer membrane biosynthesis protein TonB
VGDIGPQQQHYDVLPVPAYGLEDADAWIHTMTVPPPPMPEPMPPPEPMPAPIPGPEPSPIPEPGPTPGPAPDPAPLPTGPREA